MTKVCDYAASSRVAIICHPAYFLCPYPSKGNSIADCLVDVRFQLVSYEMAA